MTDDRFLIVEDPLNLAHRLDMALSPEYSVTLTQSETTLQQLYSQDPSRFTKVVIIKPELSQAAFRLVTSLQSISPYAEIIILTDETNYKSLYEFIRVGVTLYPQSITPETLCQSDGLAQLKAEERINQYLCLATQNKLKADPTPENSDAIRKCTTYLKERRAKASILIVEPEPSYEHLLKHTLIKQYDLKTTSTGTDALKLLEKKAFDLILLPDCLPDLPIVPTLEKIKDSAPQSRRILLTCIGASEALKKWHRGGIHNTFFKPLPAPTQLISTLEKELEKKLLCSLFNSDESHRVLNLFSKIEKTQFLEEIYRIKQSVQTPLYFEDILKFFPEANIHETYAKHAVPDSRLRAGVSAFLQKDF